RPGIALALSPTRNSSLEAIVLRIIRITLLTLVPMLAIGALSSACSDDTTSTVGNDMSVARDLSTPVVVHDLAHGD
ncbi:MAG: hypothetical protein JWM53_1675, partial [bacterium]|nr:hypothetical protein [bacterium]